MDSPYVHTVSRAAPRLRRLFAGKRICWTSSQLARFETAELTGLPRKLDIQTIAEPQPVPGAAPDDGSFREGERLLTTLSGQSKSPGVTRGFSASCRH